jgi:peptide/nickel transport system permease protein
MSGTPATPATAARLTSSRWRRAVDFLRDVADRPAGKVGLAVVAGLIIVIVLAPLLAPYDPAQQDIPARFQGPSAEHLLGTDELGRDLLSRVIYGARIALGVAVPTVALASLLGLVMGVLAGYLGGFTDRGMVVIIDALASVPAIVLALAVIAVLGPSVTNLILVLAIAFAPGYARVVRAMALSTKRRPFVEAERALGAGRWRIVRQHIIPNLLAPMLVLMAMDLPSVIAAEAGLSFFGLGVPPPAPSWGVMLSTGFVYVRDSPWTLIAAALALAITTIGITLFGESLRDVVDPKLAGRRRGRAA